MTDPLELLRCPTCGSRLEGTDELVCTGCGARYPVIDGIPRLLDEQAPGIREKRLEAEGWAAIARDEAERLWPVSADRSLRLRPGVRGGIGTPVKAVLRKMMRWYVEPLAYDQRSFNAATLRLIDDLQAQVDRLQAELREARGTTERP